MHTTTSIEDGNQPNRGSLWTSVIDTLKPNRQKRASECVGELAQAIQDLDNDPDNGPASGAGLGNAFKMGGPYALNVRQIICKELDRTTWDDHTKFRHIGRVLGCFLASLQNTNDLLREDFTRHVQACVDHLERRFNQEQPTDEEGAPLDFHDDVRTLFLDGIKRGAKYPRHDLGEIAARVRKQHDKTLKEAGARKHIREAAEVAAPREPQGALLIKGDEQPAIGWNKNLQGNIVADNLTNVVIFLKYARIEPWFNEFDQRYYLYGYGNGELNDTSLRDLRMSMHELGCKAKVDLVESGVKWMADRNKQHPLRLYLDDVEKKWDGTPRIDSWLPTYVGAKDDAFSRAAGRAWMIMAIRRVRKPGCLARTMLVLEGPQDVGKSTVFRILAGEPYYSDSLPIGAEPKVVIEECVGKWIIECAELERKTKKQVGEIRTFVSRISDTARVAWGRTAQTVPRQFVLAGTTNASKYLIDKSGNARFWPIKTGRVDLDALRSDRDQLWGEAAHFERKGEQHWLTGGLADLAAKVAAKREVNTPLEDRWTELLNNAPAGFAPSEELWRAVGLENAGQRNQNHNDSLGDATHKRGWLFRQKRRNGPKVSGYVSPGSDVAAARWLKYDGRKLALDR